MVDMKKVYKLLDDMGIKYDLFDEGETVHIGGNDNKIVLTVWNWNGNYGCEATDMEVFEKYSDKEKYPYIDESEVSQIELKEYKSLRGVRGFIKKHLGL